MNTFIYRSLILIQISFFAKSMKVILTSPYYPLSNCSLEHPSDQDLIIGIEIEFIRKVLANLNMNQGKDYIFECRDWDTMFADVKTINSTILGAIGGISITSSRMEDGYIFTQPTYLDDMAVLFNNKKKAWFFTRAFSWDVALVLFSIPLSVAIFVYYFELKQFPLDDYIFHSIFSFFHMKLLEYFTYPSKVIIQSAWFCIVVLVTIYTSIMTNIFYDDKYYGGLYSIDNIPGKTFHVLDIYSDILLEKNAIVVTFPSSFSTEDMYDYIIKNDVTYFAIDSPVVDYFSMINCNYYIALNDVIEFEFGMMTNSDINKEELHLINRAINIEMQSIAQDARTTNFFQNQSISICANKMPLGMSIIKFNDIIILWIFFLVILGFGIIPSIFSCCRTKYRKSIGLSTMQGCRSKQNKILNLKICNYFAFFMGNSITDLQKYNKMVMIPFNEFLASNPKIAKLFKKKRINRKINMSESRISNITHLNKDKKQKQAKIKLKIPKNKGYLEKAIKFCQESSILDIYAKSNRSSSRQFIENQSFRRLKTQFQMDDDFQERIFGYLTSRNKQVEYEARGFKEYIKEMTKRKII